MSETRETLESLKKNWLAPMSDLLIFSDGPKNEASHDAVDLVRDYLKTVSGFKTVRIFESAENKGLAQSVIDGVSRVLDEYDRVIVLEDDLVTAPNFLSYLNEALDFYHEETQLQSISAYSLSLSDKSSGYYFQTRPASWGWATWKDRWNPAIFNKEQIRAEIQSGTVNLKQFKKRCGNDISGMLLDSLSGKNDSWYVRWTYDHYKKNRYTLYPAYSFVTNIGHQENATHCTGINTYVSEAVDPRQIKFEFPLFREPNRRTSSEFLNYFTHRYKIIFRLKLLQRAEGRTQLFNEIRNRIRKDK